MGYPRHYCFNIASHTSQTITAKEGMTFKKLCISGGSAGLRATFGTEWTQANCFCVPAQGVYHADLTAIPANVQHITLYNSANAAIDGSVFLEGIGTVVPEWDSI